MIMSNLSQLSYLLINKLKSVKTSKAPVSNVGNQNEKINIEENDKLMKYLKNFIKSNKIKNSTHQEREKDQMVNKLKEFLVYLEDKNLINSKIQDTKQLQDIVDQLLSSEQTTGHFYDNRRKSNPNRDSYNIKKVNEKQGNQEIRDSSVEETLSNLSKRKQSQRLIFQQSRSERSSGESSKNKSMKMRKKSAAKSKMTSNESSSLGRDLPKNALANNRKIIASATNATKNLPKSGLLLMNSNRNAYKDEDNM
jgi:hypothetical protein